jgi:hypothetical protein
MSAAALLMCFTVGAALLALWMDTRFPGLAPPSMMRIVLHTGGALIVAQFVVPIAMGMLAGWGPLVPMLLVGLVLLFLPALVYTFLGSLWLMRKLVSQMPGS